jgi:predicted MPP superfamily phosphohydrolase
VINFTWCTIVLAVLAGHFGLNLAVYNRINAYGWPRRLIKRITKVFFAFTVLFPIAMLLFYHDLLGDLMLGRPDELPIPILMQAYAYLCLASWPVLGIPWLLYRPIFGPIFGPMSNALFGRTLGFDWLVTDRRIEVVRVEQLLGHSLSLSRKCKWQARLPLNQIFDLAIEEVTLPVTGLPEELDGYRIAQLSDVHLTGDIHGDFSRYAVERATGWRPDLIALTGDIIDKSSCIAWLGDIFGRASAPDGCYYVLGNHDTRVADSVQTRKAMDQAGWTDLGSRGLHRQLRGLPCLLIGNEHPWYRRPDINPICEESFRLLVSHSPDQLHWAREHQVHLMLAGHTHGGQGRLPFLGPLLSPSLHGSRYASGDFYRAPTTMHVSRGFSGTHLMRINCRPELSLLTLRSPSPADANT